MLISFAIFIVILLFIIVSAYNSIIRKRESVTNSLKNISVQLDARNKKFDSLVEAVKKYLSHEEGLLTKIVSLRNNVISSSTTEQGRDASDKISNFLKSGTVNVVLENYPELKSNVNMLQLQEELINIENKLSFSKNSYNNCLEALNKVVKTFPNVFVYELFNSKLKYDFDYWQLPESKIQESEERTIKFD